MSITQADSKKEARRTSQPPAQVSQWLINGVRAPERVRHRLWGTVGYLQQWNNGTRQGNSMAQW